LALANHTAMQFTWPPIPTVTNSWTHTAANRHTTTSQSDTLVFNAVI